MIVVILNIILCKKKANKKHFHSLDSPRIKRIKTTINFICNAKQIGIFKITCISVVCFIVIIVILNLLWRKFVETFAHPFNKLAPKYSVEADRNVAHRFYKLPPK